MIPADQMSDQFPDAPDAEKDRVAGILRQRQDGRDHRLAGGAQIGQ